MILEVKDRARDYHERDKCCYDAHNQLHTCEQCSWHADMRDQKGFVECSSESPAHQIVHILGEVYGWIPQKHTPNRCIIYHLTVQEINSTRLTIE